MGPRIDYSRIEPDAANGIRTMTDFVRKSTLGQTLRDLIYIRASQVNGCAYCLDMHTQDARANGETEQRINCISVWRESPFYTAKEKAALEFTEVMTGLSNGVLSEGLVSQVRESFNDHEYVALIMAINVINCWNRLMIGCGGTAGMYRNSELVRGMPGFFAGKP